MRLNLIFVLIVLIVFYFIVPLLVLFFINNDKIYARFKRIYLSLFFIVLFIGVFGKIDMNNKVIFIGFDFSGGFFSKQIITAFPRFKLDILLNVLMLIPVGEILFLDKVKLNKNITIFSSFLIGFFIGVFIELLQFVLPVVRLVQLSDIIYNSISSVLGYIIVSLSFYVYKIIINLIKKNDDI